MTDLLNAKVSAGVLEWNNKRPGGGCIFAWRDEKTALAKLILEDLKDLIARTQKQRDAIDKIANNDSRLLEQMSEAISACVDHPDCFFCGNPITPEQVAVGQIIDNNGAYKPVKVHCHCDYNSQILFNARIVAFTQHQPPLKLMGQPKEVEANDSPKLTRQVKRKKAAE